MTMEKVDTLLSDMKFKAHVGLCFTADNTTLESLTPGQTYKLAIFQLLDDLERVTPCLAFISFCMGCINVPLDLLLIGGACFRKAWPLAPWLVITLLEHMIVGK